MPTALKWILISLAVVLVGAFGFLSFMAGNPKDVYYMVRYAFPHMRLGNVKVGELAPDAQLVALDGSTTFHIRDKTVGRPLVLVFGSFT